MNTTAAIIVARVRQWLHGKLDPDGSRPALRNLTVRRPISIHIDELLPDLRGADREQLLEASCEAYLALVAAIQPTHTRHMVMLIIDLQPASRVITTPPDMSRLAQYMYFLPPSLTFPPDLVVVHRDSCKHYWICEEYRRPVEWPELTSRCPGARVSYHVSKMGPEMQSAREYSRSIQVRHYPRELLPEQQDA